MFGRDQGDALTDRPYLRRAKAAAVTLFFLALAYAGQRGRHYAQLQVRVAEIAAARDQVLSSLQADQTSHARTLSTPAAPDGSSTRPRSAIEPSLTSLRSLLAQFEAQHRLNQLARVESLEVRLAQATLANAEQRFNDALAVVTETEERVPLVSATSPSEQIARVLQVRADALFGLGQWQDALPRYQKLLAIKPHRLTTTQRVAECFRRLGKQQEANAASRDLAARYRVRGHAQLSEGKWEMAFEIYQKAAAIEAQLLNEARQASSASELAAIHLDLGNALLAGGKLEEASVQYGKAIELLTKIADQPGNRDLVLLLALGQNSLGHALLLAGKPEVAASHYAAAIELHRQLVEQGGTPEMRTELALSRRDHGHALLGQQKLDAAAAEYDAAVEILGRLVATEGRGDLSDELALSRNNRAALWCAQGKLDSAMAEFEASVALLAPLARRPNAPEPNRRPSRQPKARLDVAISYADRSLDVLTRTRLDDGSSRDLGVALAISHRNRGYGYLRQGKPELAVKDFDHSVEILAALMDERGQKDLSGQLARSLVPQAWVYATAPDPALRQGSTALDRATRACQLTEWKSPPALEALAAASAEVGQFPEAIKWQQRAIALAPVPQRPPMLARYEQYKSGTPFRSSSPPRKL